MRLIFVRHGEPDYANDCLTENGVLQAQCTADRLKRESIQAVYASPMGRAMETAGYTARAFGLPVQPLDFMHEINWGDADPTHTDAKHKLAYDGHPWTLAYKLLTEQPEYVGSKEWSRHHFFRDNLCMEYYAMISDRIDEFLKGYGLARKNGLYACERRCDDTIALFAHGGSGAVLFSHVMSLPFPFVLTSLSYGVCSVSILTFDGDPGAMAVPRFELFNDMGHLDKVRLEKLHFDK